jgi:hypothetical protein
MLSESLAQLLRKVKRQTLEVFFAKAVQDVELKKQA